jgi:UDP-glucuronate 4-epimerase
MDASLANLEIVGFDDFSNDEFEDEFENEYSDKLKQLRFDQLCFHDRFTMVRGDISNINDVESLFDQHNFDIIYHFAAKAGVRESVNNPDAYTKTNLTGFANILEYSRRAKVKHLIFASSSSVYGDAKHCSKEDDNTDYPSSYYAATKKANEVMAASYSKQFNMKISGIRLFTVYGPWGRPDMATWKFTKAILNNTPITVFDGGTTSRTFTYIDDVVFCLKRFINIEFNPSYVARKPDNFQIYNIAAGYPVNVSTWVSWLENKIGKDAIIIAAPLDKCEAKSTQANTDKFSNHFNVMVSVTPYDVGISNFVDWYKSSF